MHYPPLSLTFPVLHQKAISPIIYFNSEDLHICWRDLQLGKKLTGGSFKSGSHLPEEEKCCSFLNKRRAAKTILSWIKIVDRNMFRSSADLSFAFRH